VFQQFHLVPYLNVLDNVLVSSLAKPDGHAKENARRLLDHFGMTARKEHLPGELSTGERQRTALARALLNSPKLLLADEPTGNLDDENAAIILDYLREFAEQGGSVLLVTHDPLVSKYAERIELLKSGKFCRE